MKILLFFVVIAAVLFGLIYTQWGLPSSVQYCNNLLKVEYPSQSTGTRYLHVPSFATVATCGDICKFEICPNCPPEEWTCNREDDL